MKWSFLTRRSIGCLHERVGPRRPFAVRKRQRLRLTIRPTETVTLATLPWKALCEVPVSQTRSMVRPESAIRRRVSLDLRLTLERGSTRSPQTELPGPLGVAPGLPAGCLPLQAPPFGVSGAPP